MTIAIDIFMDISILEDETIILSHNIEYQKNGDLSKILLLQVELEQPMFGANYIKGKVRAQPNGNWVGEAKFKLMFKSGGAIDFGQAMLKAAYMGTQNH